MCPKTFEMHLVFMPNWLQTETQDNRISNDIYMNTLSQQDYYIRFKLSEARTYV